MSRLLRRECQGPVTAWGGDAESQPPNLSSLSTRALRKSASQVETQRPTVNMRKLSQLSGESTVVKEVPANNSARASHYVVWFSKATVRNGTFYLIKEGEQ